MNFLSPQETKALDAAPKVGDVWRALESEWSFSDHVVIKVEDKNATLARPYAYATEHGSVLTGVEVYSVLISHMLNPNWLRIGTGHVT